MMQDDGIAVVRYQIVPVRRLFRRFPYLAALLVSVSVGCSRAQPSPSVVSTSPSGSPSGSAGAQPPASVSERTTLAPPASPPPPACVPEPSVTFFTSPQVPSAGVPLRVLAISDVPLGGELRVSDVVGSVRQGGPPYFWLAEIEEPVAGKVKASFVQGCASSVPAKEITIAKRRPAPAAAPKNGVWPARNAWDHGFENLYSAWIETMFDAPEGELPTWPALYEVLRDPKRNLLYDYLGASEDSGKGAPALRPDCADLPYFLRAYFAWKMRLPFGIAECTRGGKGEPPVCKGLVTNEDPDDAAEEKKANGAVATFGAFVRGTVANRVHSGSARAPFEDENADYYPVALTWDELRPGTVYADPYGHVLVVAKRVAQTADHAGILYAVDGQPDGTVSRKRFWRGNFLYATDRALGGPGFKHFRPLPRKGGHLVRGSDAEIADVSRSSQALDVEGFYDAMDDLLTPRPLDPERAFLSTIDALEEQVRTRVVSVENGRKWLETARSPAPMPEGAEIFETTGVWEDFSTPARDLRLLIALDVVASFPERWQRRHPGSPAVDLGKVLARELAARGVTYTRTNGSPFKLTLADVLARKPAFEATYNPNDCVELRWGAPEGSDESSTCRVRAPNEQRARMESSRAWFRDRKRPPRR